MRKFRATRLPASVIDEAIDAREVIELYVSKVGAPSVLLLPASAWEDSVKAEYAATGTSIVMTREMLTAERITRIVQHQVDAKWNPLTYGALMAGLRVRAFLVPANAFWKNAVEGEKEQ